MQAKWAKGSGKTEKSFMGGESFQGFESGDGVEAVLDKDDFRRETLEKVGALWEPKAGSIATPD